MVYPEKNKIPLLKKRSSNPSPSVLPVALKTYDCVDHTFKNGEKGRLHKNNSTLIKG
jgi:hypothetical protein